MSYSSIGEIQAAGIGVEIDEIVGCCNWKADELRYYFNRKNIQLLKASDNRRKSRSATYHSVGVLFGALLGI